MAISIYNKLKALLETNQELMLSKLDLSHTKLSSQIDKNKDIVALMFEEIKGDISELKEHVKRTNGCVKDNSDKILILEEARRAEDVSKRRLWGVISGVVVTIVGGIIIWLITNGKYL